MIAMEEKQVILVDEFDRPLGCAGKMEAHDKGLLHRAFSVFIFNKKGEMLLQQRALHKYHSAGLWSNACCSHPAPGEDLNEAAIKRLEEEMGFSTYLEKAFDFIYHTEFGNGLTEHEFDHVYVGIYSDAINANPDEVKDFCFKSMNEIRTSIGVAPTKYTAWFRIAFPGIEDWYNRNLGKIIPEENKL